MQVLFLVPPRLLLVHPSRSCAANSACCASSVYSQALLPSPYLSSTRATRFRSRQAYLGLARSSGRSKSSRLRQQCMQLW